jgi:hypothetical protein
MRKRDREEATEVLSDVDKLNYKTLFQKKSPDEK